MRRDIRAVIIFMVFYIGLGGILALWQERFIYRPDKQDFWNCPAAARAQLAPKEHRGTRMYVSEVAASHTPAAVVYHGNAGSACDRTYYSSLLLAAGYAPILVEYAGYSADPEPPSHQRIKRDVTNVIDYLHLQSITEVVVIGESIGSGPASYHAALAPPARLVLITPFTSLRDLARYHYWFYPSGLVVDNAFDNVALLARYQGPLLLLHGKRDTVVPPEMSEALAASRPAFSNHIVLLTAGHNDIYSHSEFVPTLQSWLTATSSQ